MPGITAVIPVKEGALAKQRLASALDATQRAALVLCMLEDVLAALAPLLGAGLTDAIVVTADPAAASLARNYAALCIDEGARDGHIPAIASGMRTAAGRGRAGVLVLPGDIPAVATADLAAVLAAHGPAPAFTIAPSQDAMGSNAVLCSPPALVPPCFGADSYRRHLAAARAVGIEPRVIHAPGIALDIDTPADLLALQRTPGQQAARTLRYLASLDLDTLAAAVAR
jgi:2-phospho-L-lactate guanylyltransferase